MFEIQLTTLAESLYNKFAHDLLYKGYAGHLTREDEMVIDLSHGLSLCYGLCVMYMKDRLELACNADGAKRGGDALVPESEAKIAHEVVENGERFFNTLTRASGRFPVLPKAPEALPNECHTIKCG